MRCRTFPHAPRLEPDLRLSPHPAQHLGSFLGVLQTIKHLSHFRSRLHARARGRQNIPQPMFGIISLRIRVILPHAPELPRLGAFAMGPHPRVDGFPVRRLRRPIRHLPGPWHFVRGLPLPTVHLPCHSSGGFPCSAWKTQTARCRWRVSLLAPSALCGSPGFAQRVGQVDLCYYGKASMAGLPQSLLSPLVYDFRLAWLT